MIATPRAYLRAIIIGIDTGTRSSLWQFEVRSADRMVSMSESLHRLRAGPPMSAVYSMLSSKIYRRAPTSAISVPAFAAPWR